MVLIDGEPDAGEGFALTDAGLLPIILALCGGRMFELHISCSQVHTVQHTQAAMDDGRDTSQSCYFCTFPFKRFPMHDFEGIY